ncbi:MAG: hypothetical protein A2X94_10345 [Bdellovibrionales bacterium GWB1_55_8]|nr:MAG: hypothetical protein A2X94_10345 [Bdellovibrionales bacterium GWB1_55_8]
MNLPDLSIKRPVFITSVFFLLLVLGAISLKRLGVDLYPDINFPIVAVSVVYPGAGPNEIEALVTKPIEDNVSTLGGLNSLKSTSSEGVSIIIAEFTLDTDIKYAEQQVRDRVAMLKSKLPTDILEPMVRTFDPADMPIVRIAVSASKLKPAELYDLVEHDVKPMLEQVKDVALVDILGGQKREIQILLERDRLKNYGISASQIVSRIGAAGKNVPAGKSNFRGKDSDVRTLGEFESLKDIGSTLVNFFGNETPVRISDMGEVRDGLTEEKTRTFVGGQQALTLSVFRRSGANTVAVVDNVKERAAKINQMFKDRVEGFSLSVVQDGAKPIRANVDDVSESIVLGIVLTILVVYFFLGSGRSTFITSIALPNSLLGAFILMLAAGFTINIMTLLAMSLAVGLLVDDAIVVRENIFRHIELGESPREAASRGTKEVTLAVIATSATVVAVFGPIAFLDGIVGQFFKEFGLTICFAMAISLIDSLTMAPMLSAYFAGSLHRKPKAKNLLSRAVRGVLESFDRFQNRLEALYVRILGVTQRYPLSVLGIAFLIFLGSFVVLSGVPKNFVPASDTGELAVNLDMPPGTDLQIMNRVAAAVDQEIRTHKEVQETVLTVGGTNGEPNMASVFVRLVPSKERSMNTSAFKDVMRGAMKKHTEFNYKVQDTSGMGSGQQPFNVNFVGTDLHSLEEVSTQVLARMKNHPDLKDVDISFRPGKPEFRVVVDKKRGELLGVSTTSMGSELRTQIEGMVAAVFREKGQEYDIRVRLRDSEKNLKQNFDQTYIPNINNRLVRLADVARAVETEGPASIYRQDRGRYIQLSAGLNPKGRGMAKAMEDFNALFSSGEVKLPAGVRYEFVGQAKELQKLMKSIIFAVSLATLFIFLVLASLYESFITPFAILLVLPLAACGAFYGLAITGSSFDMFSMIGCVMLLGIATKNSILLVDYINQQMAKGKDLATSIVEAGRTRLRPIIMTSLALIAGMLPVAIGLNEASKQRTSMGIAVIGGLVTSTLLTLVVVPAAYAYIEKLRNWTGRMMKKVSGVKEESPVMGVE